MSFLLICCCMLMAIPFAVMPASALVHLQSCDEDMVLEEYGMESETDALLSRTHFSGAAFAALPHASLVGCGAADGHHDESISRGDALSKCRAMQDCFAVDYYPNHGLGAAFYCTDVAARRFYTIEDDSAMTHYYKVDGKECTTRNQGKLSMSPPLQLCDTDTVLESHAASPADALRVRTVQQGTAFAALPARFLQRCGAEHGADVGVSRQAALLKCGRSSDCFAVDYFPYGDGEIGNAYFCTDSSMTSYGYSSRESEAVHFYKVNGTSCGASARKGAQVCDADLVLTKHTTSRHNALQVRTSGTGSGFASLKGFMLKNCGSSEAPDEAISRQQAVATCRDRSDCFAVDFHPSAPGIGRAFYCSDTRLSMFWAPTSRLRGNTAVVVEHLYKVQGTSCACSLAQ
jgi:hypothetical protein